MGKIAEIDSLLNASLYANKMMTVQRKEEKYTKSLENTAQ